TTGLLEEHYLRRVRALPEPTQRLLTIAAADPTGDATLLWRAAQAVGIGHDPAASARAEQLLEIGSGGRFRPPLIRAAAVAARPPGRWRTRPTPRRPGTVAWGPSPPRPRGRTRMWQPSWSAPPIAPRPARGWRQRLRSCSAPSH